MRRLLLITVIALCSLPCTYLYSIQAQSGATQKKAGPPTGPEKKNAAKKKDAPPATDSAKKPAGTDEQKRTADAGANAAQGASPGTSGASGQGGGSAAKVEIKDVAPSPANASANPQLLTLTGTGFKKDLTASLTSPDGKKTDVGATDVTYVSDSEARVKATLGPTGEWKISVTNPDKTASADYPFKVIDQDSASVQAYRCVFWVVTILLSVMAAALLVGLIVSAAKGTWNLGTALSEEASVQPQQINSPADILMVGSTSRLIALVGLLGILAVVLGIGYSIIWSLFVVGKVPDLSGIKSFLFGAASLFAPYLANQVRAAFESSSTPTTQASGQASTSTAITGVIPASPTAGAAAVDLTLTGSGFQPGSVVTVITPQGTEQDIAAAQITIHPTQVVLRTTLSSPGTWKVKVTAPGGIPSVTQSLMVVGPPTITTHDPTTPVASADQTLSFIGTGFLPGLTVTLTPPGGGAPINVAEPDLTVEYTKIVLPARRYAAGNWQVIATNRGGYASAAHALTVNA